MFGGQSEQGSDVGTEEEEFVSAALGAAPIAISTSRGHFAFIEHLFQGR